MACIVLAFATFLTGCGKKGPPLAPFVRIPAAVDTIDARRAGSDVYVTLTVPKQNLDESVPVSISRVEIYGYTGRIAPPRARWVELGTLIATIPIVPAPADAGSDDPASVRPGAESDPDVRRAGPLDPPVDAAFPGTVITIHDPLAADELVQGPTAFGAQPLSGAALPVADAPTLPLRRFYTAYGFSPRGRPGPPGKTAEVALTPLPDAPSGLRATYTETQVTLTWEPSGGIIGFLLDTELGPEEAPLGDFEEQEKMVPGAPRGEVLPPGPTSYNVYRELEPDPLAPPPAARVSIWSAPAPAPVNAAPVKTLSVIDTVQLGRRHCYTVRAVRGSGPQAVESEPSTPLCITPIDVFPPAPPRSLAAVPSGNAISLVWEANDEPDVAGYLVLRGEAPGATLQSLTSAPIAEPRYRDGEVTPGVRYVYAVVAVDNRLPLPNVSAQSARVEETAP